MLDSTKTICRTALNADPTVDEKERNAWAMLLAKGSPVSASSVASEPLPRLVHIREVQKLTGLTQQAIRGYARKGALVRIVAPGTNRGRGYTEASVRAFLEGRAAK